MATHSSTFAWEMPWTEEPGRLQSIRSQRVKTRLSMHACTHTNFIITQQIQSIIISVYNQYKNYWHISHSVALSLKLECTSNLYWRRKWQPTPAFLPGKSQGLRILVGYSPWGCKGSDTTERLHFTSNLHTLIKTSHISIAQRPRRVCGYFVR